VVALLRVVDRPGGHRLPQPRPDEEKPHDDEQRVRVEVEEEPLRARQARRVRGGVGADALLLVGLEADLVEPLRLVRAFLDEPDRGEDEREELEVFRLPVLEHGCPVLGREDVLPVADRRVAVRGELRVVVLPAGDGLAAQGGQEEDAEAQGKAVLVGPASHWCVIPITE
jgi:hypothetical protein